MIAVMSGSADASSTFTTDSLTISGIGAQSTAVRAAQSALESNVDAHVHAPEAFAADDSVVTQELRTHAESSRRVVAASFAARSTVTASAAVGAQAQIWVQQGGYSSRSFVQVPATMIAQTAHGNIWVQNTLVSTVSSGAQQIGSAFENAYASDTAHFASPDYPSGAPGLQPQYSTCDANGNRTGSAPAYIAEPADHRINVMIVDSSSLGGVGGYFSSVNYMTQAALNCLGGGYKTNEAPFIVAGWFGAYGTQYEFGEDMVRSNAHELQHLINFVNHALLAPAASNASYNGNEAQYLNEGLSMLAQDFAIDRMYGSQGVHFDAADALTRAQVYLAAPASFSISGFSGIDPATWGGNGSSRYNCSGGCYGGVYLLARYLHDRFGDRLTQSIETSGVVGASNLQAVTGENPGQVFGDFALAMSGATLGVPAAAVDQRFAFAGLNLKGSYTDQFGHALVLKGVAASTLPANGALSVPVGGFAFVSVPSVPSAGMSVQVTDSQTVSGFNLLGGLAQH